MDNLNKNETIEDLQYQGLKIIQNKTCFCFGMDAILLSDFANIRNNETVLDLCTGCGIVPIMLYAKKRASKIVGVEIMEYVADIAKRSMQLNNIQHIVDILNDDLKNLHPNTHGFFDVITVNPPYDKTQYQQLSDNAFKASARHEVHCTLDDVCKTASRMLKFGGRLYMIHRTTRLCEIFDTLIQYKLEPKVMRTVYPKPGQNGDLVLIQATKGANQGLIVKSPLIVRNENGNYTKEIDSIYHRI